MSSIDKKKPWSGTNKVLIKEVSVLKTYKLFDNKYLSDILRGKKQSRKKVHGKCKTL